MSNIEVALTMSEMQIAATVGMMRQIENLAKGRRDAYGAEKEDGWQYHIEGAGGELAFAKWSGRYWNGALGNLKADDVGDTQVRTAMAHHKRLIIHPPDANDRRFVLVTGVMPRFLIRGWIWGGDGKQERFWCDPKGARPAYFVPTDFLYPMPDRSKLVRARREPDPPGQAEPPRRRANLFITDAEP
jgi:hypothetical protein